MVSTINVVVRVGCPSIMKILFRIIFWSFVLILLVYVGGSIFFVTQGKAFLEERLSYFCQRPVTLRSATLTLPLGLRVEELVIPKIVQARSAQLHISLTKIFSRPLVISHLEFFDATFFVVRTKAGRLFWEGLAAQPIVPRTTGKAGGASSSTEKPGPAPWAKGVIVERLDVKNGILIFSDFKNEQPVSGSMEQLRLQAQRVVYPLAAGKMPFYFAGLLFSKAFPFSGHRVEGQGWIDIQALGMDAVLKLLEQDGRAGLVAQLVADKNDMTVKGKINLGLFGATTEKKAADEITVQDFALGVLQSSGLDIDMNFSFRTEMNNFQVDTIGVNGQVNLKGQGKTGTNAEATTTSTAVPAQQTLEEKMKEGQIK